MTTVAPMSRLIEFGAATLHEANERLGAMDSRLKPIAPEMKLAGPVFTVRCARGDNLALHYAVSVAPSGCVLAVDAGGYLEAGLWGDILAEAALARGIVGLVIDGAVRDCDAMIALRFPVFAAGVSIKGPTKDKGGAVGGVIACGGIELMPGDYLVGDRDGVVAIARTRLEAALSAAGARARKEDEIRLGLAKGLTTLDLLDLHDLIHKTGLAPPPARAGS